MAARGSLVKEEITKKILETFEGSFLYNQKEIRIPMMENGELIQVKVTLTAAKENVDNGGDAITPTVEAAPATSERVEITAEEKKETLDLLKAFGF